MSGYGEVVVKLTIEVTISNTTRADTSWTLDNLVTYLAGNGLLCPPDGIVTALSHTVEVLHPTDDAQDRA